MQSSTPKPSSKRRLCHRIRPAKKRKGMVKKEVSDNSDSGDIADESNSSENEHIDWNRLEAELEENAAKANLTAVNVKSILHAILIDKRVIDYAKTAADSVQSHAVLETKLTRSKAKLLGKNPLPLPNQKRCEPKFLDLDFTGSSSDEEYQPKEDDDDTSQASDEDLSTYSDALSEVQTPQSKHRDEALAELNIGGNTQSILIQNQLSISVPSSTKKELFKVPALPKQAVDTKDTDLIASRTRSRLPMPDVEVEELEALFQPPDSTPLDFSVKSYDDEDEVIWKQWLKDFMKPIKALNETPDEDPNDEDFNYMKAAAEDDTEIEGEELRDDKATRVTQKELQDLFNGLLLGYEQQHNEGACVQNWDLSMDENTEFDINPEIPDAAKDLVISFEQRQQITAQMQQHVQLLTQVYLLSCTNQSSRLEAAHCKQYVEELAKFHDKAVENSEHQGNINATFSTFCTPGISDAYRIVLSLHGQRLSTKSLKVSYNYYPINYTIAEILATEPYFATYIELLPEQGMRPDVSTEDSSVRKPIASRMKFSSTEDNLLALGLDQWKKRKDKYQLISEHLLPTKTPKQLVVRIKNLSSQRESRNNPVAVLKKDKYLPNLPVKFNIIVPRDVSASALCDLPRSIWRKRLAPPWYSKLNRRIQSEIGVKLEDKVVKDHETRNQLFSIAAKDVDDGIRVGRNTISMENSQPITLPMALVPSIRARITTETISLGQYSAFLSSTSVSREASKVAPNRRVTAAQNAIEQTGNLEHVLSTISTPPTKYSNLSEYVKNCCQAINFSALNSSTATSNLLRKPTISQTDTSFSLNSPNQRTFSEAEISNNVTNITDKSVHIVTSDISADTPLKTSSLNTFSAPIDNLLEGISSPKDVSQFNLTSSNFYENYSLQDVKQILKTPQKTKSTNSTDMLVTPNLVTSKEEMECDKSFVQDDSLEGSHHLVISMLTPNICQTEEERVIDPSVENTLSHSDIVPEVESDAKREIINSVVAPISDKGNVTRESVCKNIFDDCSNMADTKQFNLSFPSDNKGKQKLTCTVEDVQKPLNIFNRAQIGSSERMPIKAPFINTANELDRKTTTTVGEQSSSVLISPNQTSSLSCGSGPVVSDTELDNLTNSRSKELSTSSKIEERPKSEEDCYKENEKQKTSIRRRARKKTVKETSGSSILTFDYKERLKKKAQTFVKIYFNRVKEALKNEPPLLQVFFQTIHDVHENKLTKLEAYYKLSVVLKDYPDLVDNFACLLEQHESRHAGKFLHWMLYDQLIHFHLACEQYYFNVPGWYTKINEKIVEAIAKEKNPVKIVESVTPLFRGNHTLANQFVRLFPDLPPPLCEDDEFEVIDFAAVSSGTKVLDDFEEISYNQTENDAHNVNEEPKLRHKKSRAIIKDGVAYSRQKSSSTKIAASKLRQLAERRKKNKSFHKASLTLINSESPTSLENVSSYSAVSTTDQDNDTSFEEIQHRNANENLDFVTEHRIKALQSVQDTVSTGMESGDTVGDNIPAFGVPTNKVTQATILEIPKATEEENQVTNITDGSGNTLNFSQQEVMDKNDSLNESMFAKNEVTIVCDLTFPHYSDYLQKDQSLVNDTLIKSDIASTCDLTFPHSSVLLQANSSSNVSASSLTFEGKISPLKRPSHDLNLENKQTKACKRDPFLMSPGNLNDSFVASDANTGSFIEIITDESMHHVLTDRRSQTMSNVAKTGLMVQPKTSTLSLVPAQENCRSCDVDFAVVSSEKGIKSTINLEISSDTQSLLMNEIADEEINKKKSSNVSPIKNDIVGSKKQLATECKLGAAKNSEIKTSNVETSLQCFEQSNCNSFQKKTPRRVKTILLREASNSSTDLVKEDNNFSSQETQKNVQVDFDDNTLKKNESRILRKKSTLCNDTKASVKFVDKNKIGQDVTISDDNLTDSEVESIMRHTIPKGISTPKIKCMTSPLLRTQNIQFEGDLLTREYKQTLADSTDQHGHLAIDILDISHACRSGEQVTANTSTFAVNKDSSNEQTDSCQEKPPRRVKTVLLRDDSKSSRLSIDAEQNATLPPLKLQDTKCLERREVFNGANALQHDLSHKNEKRVISEASSKVDIVGILLPKLHSSNPELVQQRPQPQSVALSKVTTADTLTHFPEHEVNNVTKEKSYNHDTSQLHRTAFNSLHPRENEPQESNNRATHTTRNTATEKEILETIKMDKPKFSATDFEIQKKETTTFATFDFEEVLTKKQNSTETSLLMEKPAEEMDNTWTIDDDRVILTVVQVFGHANDTAIKEISEKLQGRYSITQIQTRLDMLLEGFDETEESSDENSEAE